MVERFDLREMRFQRDFQSPCIKRFVAHPSWNYPSMFDNDIAVLELEFGAQERGAATSFYIIMCMVGD